ncbi:hypothetical protein [Leptolyngbya ohadii]|uniref:hypothetical protein n=1 Tax=Leptolyngbya ohadii TaxID=1962290 RepID=UPI000B59F6B6|nr:hypothetical protein [Leptolyngbya ohadii]
MKDLLNRISKVVASVKQFPVARAVVVLVAGAMLMFSTACGNFQPPVSSDSSPASPMSSNVPTPVESGEGSYHAKSNANQPTELYDPIQEREGGMNMYSDTDPRYQRPKLGSQIERRVDRAEQNLDRSINSVDDYVDNYTDGAPLGERIRNITDSVGKSVDNLTDQVTEGTERGSQNLKVNASRAERNAGEAVKGVADDTASNVRDAGRKAGRALDKAADRA